MADHYLGIDVGTGSARAALVRHDGILVASSTQDTLTFRDPKDARIFEQSTTNIWSAICAAVKDVLSSSGVKKEDVKGLGFDATCSLAVTDWEGKPVCVTGGKECGTYGDRNIVLWADHRAEEEADSINKTGSVVLDYVGGTMSLEMEIPKILWLKRHMPADLFSRCMFFDLPDYLTYRATSSLARSSCSLVCKCSFIPPGVANSRGWNAELFNEIGLGDIVNGGFKQLGGEIGKSGMVLTAGLPVGQGLTEDAAKDLGLVPGTPVGSAVIDAYAGWIGTIPARYRDEKDDLSPQPSLEESSHRIAAVAGTSTCHIVQTPEGIFVPGVWGPYKNALFPGSWMNEGGQSSTGQLIDFMITTHPAYSQLQALAKERNTSIHTILADTLADLQSEAGASSLTHLTKDIHFYPDLHGNRSPLADPKMRGSISGLSLDDSLSDLALKFNVTLETIALQTRHILDTMNTAGHSITSIYLSGGQAKNKALMQLLSDACRVPVILPHSHAAAVVLGAAMLGRFAAEVTTAAGHGADKAVLESQEDVERESARLGGRLWDIMVEMTQPGTKIAPAASKKDEKLLDAKYKIFRETIETQRRWRKEMEEAARED